MSSVTIRSRYLNDIEFGNLEAKYSASGDRVLRYYIHLRHKHLNLFKEVSAPDRTILQHKLDTLLIAWDAKQDEAHKKNKVTAGTEEAERITIEAAAKLESLGRILLDTMSVDDRVDWSSLKDRSVFQKPTRFHEPAPSQATIPDPVYRSPIFTFADAILLRKKKKLEQAQSEFNDRRAAKQIGDAELAIEYARQFADWQKRKAAFEDEVARERREFQRKQDEHNQKIEEFARTWATGNPDAIIEHATLVLERSNYRGLFEKSFEIDYNANNRALLVEYELPSPSQLPTLKSVRFVKSSGKLREMHITDKEQAENFDSACYQIALRTIHEVFEADEWNHLNVIAFNGFATDVDTTTGQDVRSCILSVVAERAEFEAVDLRRVEPKSCFKRLKGVSASSLSALVAIPPLVKIDRNDRRFIDGRDAATSVGESTNLASMSWEDFEHLVRQLFEKEFALRGGEVKVTQSSRDGGVDAVAFDPDPISGGKIVIQAKRYTKVVGVSAVRDLYGTVMNEGASKGILVTTADYGPDAHKFATGKPLTLISGANLLYLLGKHGMKARIDLRDARRELNLREFN